MDKGNATLSLITIRISLFVVAHRHYRHIDKSAVFGSELHEVHDPAHLPRRDTITNQHEGKAVSHESAMTHLSSPIMPSGYTYGHRIGLTRSVTAMILVLAPGAHKRGLKACSPVATQRPRWLFLPRASHAVGGTQLETTLSYEKAQACKQQTANGPTRAHQRSGDT